MSRGAATGPTSFVLYIKNLPSVIESLHILMYANDAKLISFFNDEHIGLQSYLNNVAAWSSTNF